LDEGFSAVGAMRKEIRISGLNPPVSHYTDAVQFGNLLFISGLAPLDAEGKLVGGDDPAAQTRKIFESMQLILNELGADFSNVLRVTVYLTNIEDRPRINPVRQEFFGETRPASTLVEVKALVVPGMRVEIEAVVGLPD
jgi:2-iminobutanoate/2-iminopropanoate deaminase